MCACAVDLGQASPQEAMPDKRTGPLCLPPNIHNPGGCAASFVLLGRHVIQQAGPELFSTSFPYTRTHTHQTHQILAGAGERHPPRPDSCAATCSHHSEYHHHHPPQTHTHAAPAHPPWRRHKYNLHARIYPDSQHTFFGLLFLLLCFSSVVFLQAPCIHVRVVAAVVAVAVASRAMSPDMLLSATTTSGGYVDTLLSSSLSPWTSF